MIYLFPYHFNTILDVVSQYAPNVRQDYQDDLAIERDKVLRGYQRVYQDHRDFIKIKNITSDNPTAFSISNDRKENLAASVFLKISEEINSDDPKFSKDSSYDVVREQLYRKKRKKSLGDKVEQLQAALPEIVNLVAEFLINTVDAKTKNAKNSDLENSISSFCDIVTFRMLEFEKIYASEFGPGSKYFQLVASVTAKLTMIDGKVLKKGFGSKDGFADDIIRWVFEAMTGKDIANYYRRKSGAHVIFY